MERGLCEHEAEFVAIVGGLTGRSVKPSTTIALTTVNIHYAIADGLESLAVRDKDKVSPISD